MAIYGANNNSIYTDSASTEFRIAVNSVDSWKYNWNNGSIRQPYQPIVRINCTLGDDGRPANSGSGAYTYILPWNVAAPGDYQGTAGWFATANTFIVPQAGIYRVSLTQLMRGAGHIWVSLNGGQWRVQQGAHLVDADRYGSLGQSIVSDLAAGDQITFRGNLNGAGNSGNIYGGGWTLGSIERLG
jgi:hypothetical protein